MNNPKDDLGPQIDKLERLLEKVPKYIPQNSVSNSSTTINGGGWVNALVMILIGGMALAMFILFLSDREAASREKTELKAQLRVDIQRIDGTLNRHAEKLETHDAYINDMFRRMKDK